MRNAGLEEAHTGVKIARRNINNLRYADDTTLMAESEEELKSLLMRAVSHEYTMKETISEAMYQDLTLTWTVIQIGRAHV